MQCHTRMVGFGVNGTGFGTELRMNELESLSGAPIVLLLIALC